MSILTSTTPVPIIYVSHLPSASSFYASLTQPLGIQFLSAAPVSPACLNYGYIQRTDAGPWKTIVFSITQSPTPSLSHITLSAPNPRAVLDFHTKSQILNKDSKRGENILEKGTEEERAVTRDFDGNMLEAVYSPLRARGGQRSGSGGRSGAPVIELETASSEKEARRVLEWQEDVARSVAGSEASKSRNGTGDGRDGHPPMKRADSYPLPTRERERIDPSRLVRRETITADPATTVKTDEGFTGKAVLGTLLGAAALAGVAYTLMRSSSPEPIPARRGSDGARAGPTSQYTHAQPMERERITERVPARSYVSERDRDGMERERAQPRYVQYTIAAPPPMTRAHTTHELSRIDERSHHSSSRLEREITMVDNEGSRFDTQSLRPRTILPEPSPERRERSPSPGHESHVSRRSHRSHRSHKSSTSNSESPRSRISSSGKEKTYHVSSSAGEKMERESSYTSARSHHTASTVKPFPPSPPAVPIPPPAASIVSTSTVRVSGKEEGGRRRRRSSTSQSQSHYSGSPTYREARGIALPESESGASHWERGSVRMVSGLGREYPEYMAGGGGLEGVGGLEGLKGLDIGGGGKGGNYAASVAPSDSISSVGVKRERDRLRERMVGRDGRERGGERGLVGGYTY